MPLMHVGCLYEHVETDPHGHKTVKISQQHFADSKNLMTVRKAEPTTPCDAKEQHDFRASIGALLYLCMTRLDLVAEVVIIQSKVCCSTIGDLLACNQVVRRAKQYSARGIIYRPLQPPLRILAISDASFATSKTSYAIEGCLVLITSQQTIALKPGENRCSPADFKKFCCGSARILHASSKKAKRISHSTSHAERFLA